MEFLAGKRLVILGCGYIGGAVARTAATRGAQVTALTRNVDTAAVLRADGIEVAVGDLADDAWHERIPEAPDFLVNCVSSGGGGIEAYRRSYLAGMASIVMWATRVGPVGTAVYTSSTSVYPQGGGASVDEMSPTDGGGERAGLLRQTEEVMRNARGAWRRWFILRLAGIYGPGRHHLLDQVRSGDIAGVGEHRLNLVHRDDAVAAILACLGAPTAIGDEIFNVADDGAARKGEVAAWLAEQVAAPAPRFAGEVASARRALVPDRVIVNSRLKARLGWRPRYPTYREGYGSFLSR